MILKRDYKQTIILARNRSALNLTGGISTGVLYDMEGQERRQPYVSSVLVSILYVDSKHNSSDTFDPC